MAYEIKNLSKYQQEVQRLHDRHCKKVSEAMVIWTLKQAFKAEFMPQIYNKNKPDLAWCPICGKVIDYGTATCPHCKSKLGVPRSYPSSNDRMHGVCSFKDWMLFEEVTTCRGWQIDRLWLADFTFRKGKSMEMTYLGSIFERWFNPAIGKEVLLGKYRGSFPYYRRIPWALSYFEPTEGYVHRTLQMETYDEYSTIRYPRVRLLDSYKKAGLDRLRKFTAGNEFAPAFRAFLTKQGAQMTETILKVGRDSEVRMMIDHHKDFAKYWRTILVSRRHGFDYDAHGQLYFDYLRQLEQLHLDLHSPKYVAPTDFHAMHQEMTGRLNAIAERERRERQRQREIKEYERAKDKEADYLKARSKFFGLLLVSKTYKAEPLKSVHEFLEEGLAMDHCVFSCGYYDTQRHPDSLILSVRETETGERAVTIEISIKTWKIQQCYAKHDHTHPEDRKIRKWINANMETIKSFSKPRRQAVAVA